MNYIARYVLVTTNSYSVIMTTANRHTVAYILRITWNPISGKRQIILKPSDGSPSQHFDDFATAIQFLERALTSQSLRTHYNVGDKGS